MYKGISNPSNTANTVAYVSEALLRLILCIRYIAASKSVVFREHTKLEFNCNIILRITRKYKLKSLRTLIFFFFSARFY